MNEIHALDRLFATIAARKAGGDTDQSYTAKLFSRGVNKVAQKVGEEAVELVIEAKDDNIDLFKNEAADLLVGQHDFASFCRKRKGATTIRTLLNVAWSRPAPHLAELEITADAFCHSMVRALVGAMLNVGDGRRDLDWLSEYLNLRVRGPGVTVAAARGLVLDHVAYPSAAEMAERQSLTRARRSLP